MSDRIRELIETLGEKSKEHIKITTVAATVKSVNWVDKTMDAVGVSSELDYFDVLLGLGSMQIKPKVGTLCLLGIIENKEAETFLIDAEEIEAYELTATNITFNGGNNAGLVKVNSLKTELARLNTNLGILKAATQVVSVALDTLLALPAPGTAFTTATNAMTAQDLTTLENTKIKH